MDGASAAHPEKGGGCTKRRPVFLDAHDVKQQKSRIAVHARAFAPRTCTDIQLGRRARSRGCGRAGARKIYRSGGFRCRHGPIGSLLPVWRRVFGPPPVSSSLVALVGANRSSERPPARRTRPRNRTAVRTTRRRRRGARSYMCLCGASGSSAAELLLG